MHVSCDSISKVGNLMIKANHFLISQWLMLDYGCASSRCEYCRKTFLHLHQCRVAPPPVLRSYSTDLGLTSNWLSSQFHNSSCFMFFLVCREKKVCRRSSPSWKMSSPLLWGCQVIFNREFTLLRTPLGLTKAFPLILEKWPDSTEFYGSDNFWLIFDLLDWAMAEVSTSRVGSKGGGGRGGIRPTILRKI
jgi:hypothetical protein